MMVHHPARPIKKSTATPSKNPPPNPPEDVLRMAQVQEHGRGGSCFSAPSETRTASLGRCGIRSGWPAQVAGPDILNPPQASERLGGKNGFALAVAKLAAARVEAGFCSVASSLSCGCGSGT